MKLTKTNITTAIAFSCLLSGSAIAEQSNKQEKTNEVIGLSSGAIIGTVIAGPLGGIIASIFGVMIADDLNSDKRLETANNSLEQKDQQLLVMQQNFEQAKERAMVQMASMDNALELAAFKQSAPEIESNIQFKTASYVLEEHYKSQLDLIAKTLQKNPNVSITLSGFADKRGDSTFNQALSEQRALTVKNYLLDKNVKEEQVITNSFGESSLVSAGTNFEDDFFDRRVMLKVSDDQTEMTAANQ
ncbi:sortase-associated OmpA-like protein PdsO [Paraglaciecola sp. MB-3u-78]|uniref:sortase-associated OmpA-like protein PdsO n=1 Tax=Paraglaciecola sp. MB-3u-78 TaxID=2058332 RepID=UPI000C33150E|nr:sortase-associated OmpA-like protein PdsO [Paraglaciecola sp. MB-3u-78]PKG98321.1 flagellar motor protein MotB [Paraglaciecola sp. MB-3u-78]